MDDIHTPPEVTRSVLNDVFPVESRVVGRENFEDICAGRIAFDEKDEAFRMTAGESLAVLANAVTVIAFLWQLMSARRAKRALDRTSVECPDQIDLQLLAAIPGSEALARDKRLALIVAVTLRR